MNRNILRTHCNDYQFFSAAKDGSMNQYSPAKIHFIHQLIRENAKFDGDGAHLFVDDLDEIDRKLLLSYLIDIEEYEYYCSFPNLLKIVLKEHETPLQELIDDHKDQVWHEDMQEMGRVLSMHSDNGEKYYR
jgi:hypothetical protein